MSSVIMNKIKIVEIKVYNEKHKIREEGIRFIPPNVADSLFHLIDKEVNRLVCIGIFTCVENDCWGNAEYGDNLIMTFENQEQCVFCMKYHYDGSILDVTVEYNEQFKRHLQDVAMLENTQLMCNMMWKKIFKKRITHPFENNYDVFEEYD